MGGREGGKGVGMEEEEDEVTIKNLQTSSVLGICIHRADLLRALPS